MILLENGVKEVKMVEYGGNIHPKIKLSRKWWEKVGMYPLNKIIKKMEVTEKSLENIGKHWKIIVNHRKDKTQHYFTNTTFFYQKELL